MLLPTSLKTAEQGSTPASLTHAEATHHTNNRTLVTVCRCISVPPSFVWRRPWPAVHPRHGDVRRQEAGASRRPPAAHQPIRLVYGHVYQPARWWQCRGRCHKPAPAPAPAPPPTPTPHTPLTPGTPHRSRTLTSTLSLDQPASTATTGTPPHPTSAVPNSAVTVITHLEAGTPTGPNAHGSLQPVWSEPWQADSARSNRQA